MRRSRGAQGSAAYRALSQQNASNTQDPAALIRSFNVEANPTRPVRPSPLAASTIRDMPLDFLERIRSFPLFNSAPEEFLIAIGQHLKPQVHSVADHVICEGDQAKSMYWIVRGTVGVTSRDGEAVYAELQPGAFFGEIAILMNIPRTATIVARSKCLLLSLKKEDLQAELPKFPDMEKLIREEAQERLNILKKKREERTVAQHQARLRENKPSPVNPKKRKSPSPSLIEDPSGGSVLGSAQVNIRATLRELPLFSALSDDVLHFLGLSASPKTYPPFTDIVTKGTPGNEIYFIVGGEAEVLIDQRYPESHAATSMDPAKPDISFFQRPRLREGQYFGEVASLGLAHKRTATVKAITTVECLMIPGPALEELWSRTDIRDQVEETAKQRYKTAHESAQDDDDDTDMLDVAHETPDSSVLAAGSDVSDQFASFAFSESLKSKASVSSLSSSGSASSASKKHDMHEVKSTPDPDPFLSVDMENMRNRRKGSIAPPTPPADMSSPISQKPSHPLALNFMSMSDSPSLPPIHSPPPDIEEMPATKRMRIMPKRRESAEQPVPDFVLESVFALFSLADVMRMRAVCAHWKRILATSQKICQDIDLSVHNRVVTDSLIKDVLAPFIGHRPRAIDISNCFHMTDEGFSILSKQCGRNVKRWRMRSVWDVSANQILEMSEVSKQMEEIDWSNCRKVGDNLLARVTGWVVPDPHPEGLRPTTSNGKKNSPAKRSAVDKAGNKTPAPGTVIGCSKLKHLNLSYCKHVTDRSMAHLALHASQRLESLTLTRCTTISDAGFHSWAQFRFTNLTRLSLADCTYLTDNAIASLVNAAKGLQYLDLSFCCALSDTSTEVVALGLPLLKELRLAFCGSAVSDGSLGCVALHLSNLEGISVRGCVRVTGGGVEALLQGCSKLKWIDASQCRNLEPWVKSGAVGLYGTDEYGGNGLKEGEEPVALERASESGPRLFPGRSLGGRGVRRDSKVTFI